MAKWRVYYDEGLVWDWKQGLDDIPIYGVLAVLQEITYKTGSNTGYQIVHGCPYYMFHNGQWLHSYENDLVDYITHNKSIDKLLVGRIVSKQVFGDVWEYIQKDKNAENL
jgi:hypothetical protein